MTIHRVVVIAGLAVVLVAPVAMSADTQHSGATQHAGTQSKAAQGQGWKKGQGWDYFAAAFDANKDGKVSKEELLAKQPGFDHMDANHDGFVTEAEYDAMPASKNHPNVKGWVARFDTNKDGKVSVEEWNAQRIKHFEMADKNKDGAIEKSEFTPDMAGNSANG